MFGAQSQKWPREVAVCMHRLFIVIYVFTSPGQDDPGKQLPWEQGVWGGGGSGHTD